MDVGGDGTATVLEAGTCTAGEGVTVAGDVMATTGGEAAAAGSGAATAGAGAATASAGAATAGGGAATAGGAVTRGTGGAVTWGACGGAAGVRGTNADCGVLPPSVVLATANDVRPLGWAFGAAAFSTAAGLCGAASSPR